MSSLRRRAIVVTFARSTERSPTGGLVSVRTTAAASLGSASIRSQASTSRTSGRWKKAASPAKRNGTLRSSSAAATRRPSRQPEPAITQIRSARTSPAASRCSTSRGDGLRLGAIVLAGARTGSRPGSAGRRRGRSRRCPGGRRGTPRAPPGRRRGSALSPGRDRTAQTRLPWAPTASSRARWAIPASSSSSASTLPNRLADLGGDVGAIVEQLAELEHQVAAVEAAGLAQDPVVAGVEVGELDLALGPLALGGVGGRALGGDRPFAQGRRARPPRL